VGIVTARDKFTIKPDEEEMYTTVWNFSKYAILHSGIYRDKYRDHLKIDFPRIPFTSDFDLFMQISGLGERLSAVHLMKSPELVRTFSKYEVIGSDLVDKPNFKPEVGGNGRVYINETQYFSNIPLEFMYG
jgi:predicted helicase